MAKAIYVSDATGNDGNSGLTELLAKETMNGALAIAAADDVIFVKADGTYTPNDNITQDGITIVGYKDTAPTSVSQWWDGDCSRDGNEYKSTWAIFDGGGANGIFDGNGNVGIRFINCKFQNIPTTSQPIDFDTNYSVSFGEGLFCDNCWFDGGQYIKLTFQEFPQFIDCKFSGTWSQNATGPWRPILYQMSAGIVYGCYFNPDIADGCINVIYYHNVVTDYAGGFIANNIFTSKAAANVLYGGLVKVAYGASVFNNTFYQPSGATYLGEKGFSDGTLLNATTSSGSLMQTIWNNIFLSDEATSPAASIGTAGEIKPFLGYNCYFGVRTPDFTLRQGDIQQDPLFEDAPNYDFRLKPGSPLFNAGYPSIAGDNIFGTSSIGSYQRGLVDNNELLEDGINLQYGKSNLQYGP
jgi:hypothetical protein